MSGNFFVDTNVLIYSYSSTEAEKSSKAQALFAEANAIISTQVLQELVNVLFKKFNTSWNDIRHTLDEVNRNCAVHVNAQTTAKYACDIAERYNFSFYDSMIISAVIEAGCAILYSEDLNSGQVIDEKLTILNPFVKIEVNETIV